MHKRTFAFVALWGVVMGALGWMSGCYGRNCEGETTFFGRKVGEGRLVAPDTWETSPTNSKWLPFPQQRVWVFETTDLGSRVPYDIDVFVSAAEDPVAENSNFVQAGGNLAEISGVGEGRFVVKNGTCADYFVRVVARAAPQAPPAPPVSTADASADAGDAGDGGDAEAGP
jgi:hypothetical protein